MPPAKRLRSARPNGSRAEVRAKRPASGNGQRIVTVGARPTLMEAVEAFLKAHGSLTFVQVGGFDGVGFDPLRHAILGGQMDGLIIEPLPGNFSKLQELYAGSPLIQLAQCAVAEADDQRTIWRFKPEAIEQGILDPHFAGMTSFRMDDLLAADGSIGRLFQGTERALLQSLVEPVLIQGRTMTSVLAQHNMDRVDLLQIDTEGYDLMVLKSFDLTRFKPAIVHFEHIHLSAAERSEAEHYLASFGYRTFPLDADTLAIRVDPDRRADAGVTAAESVDGLKGNVVFCAWTGDNPLTPHRAEALLSIYRETCCPVLFLTPHNIGRWELATAPFHPAYPHLSETHRADYLRVYLMHHFGGGYTDLKRTTRSWVDLFQRLRDMPDAVGLGYGEVSPEGVAPCGEPLESELRSNYRQLIGNCAYIFRRNTAFTRRWLNETHRVLDAKMPALVDHPARHPMDQFGVILPDGSQSRYPLGWSEMLGEIFHPLVYEFRDRIVQSDIAPSFQDYR